MDDAQVLRVDQIAEAALGMNTGGQERQQAEKMLMDLKTLDNLNALRYVLERSESQYSQFFAARAIKEVITSEWNSFVAAGNQHAELRTWLTSFIGQKGVSIPKFVRAQVIDCLCRLTKLGWLENPSFQELPAEVYKFFLQSPTPSHPIMGLDILRALVTEVTLVCPKMTLSQHRRTTISFKESLLEIFKIALQALESYHMQGKQGDDVDICVSLILGCLSFDFVGIHMDESSDDITTVQLPSSWHPLLATEKTVQLLWSVYFAAHQEKPAPPRSGDILKCMVQLASVRRSLWAEDSERSKHLEGLLEGIRTVLERQIGLDDPLSYIEFCRLLSRIKPNFQLAELIKNPNFDQWMKLCAEFTLESFRNWRQTHNSSYFLLSLWARLVAAKPYLTGQNKDTCIDQYAPSVVLGYVQSRLELAQACVQCDDIENALEDTEQLLVQLEHLPQLAKSMYGDRSPDQPGLARHLMNIAGPELETMKNLLSEVQSGQMDDGRKAAAFVELQVLDNRLAWLVYIVGSIIAHHGGSTREPNATDGLDGQITALVFSISNVISMRAEVIPGQAEMKTLHRLQAAVLYYLTGFGKVYIGVTTTACTKVYEKLRELTGVGDSLGVLRVTIDIILRILKLYKRVPTLLDAALSLFLELGDTYTGQRDANKLDSIKLLFVQHHHPDFSFVDEPCNLRRRTRFYRALAKIFHSVPKNSESGFEAFMSPFREKAARLSTLQPAQFAAPDVKLAVIGLFRDLRGVCIASSTRKTYEKFFDWVFPYIHAQQAAETPLFLKICQVYTTDHDVAIPLLRFYAELVHGLSARIMFDASSPNGILLFREVSAMLKCYGTLKLAEVCQSGQPGCAPLAPTTSADSGMQYKKVYKGMMLCMQILSRSLIGNFCNFGVFALYGDPALDDALEVVLKMVCPHARRASCLSRSFSFTVSFRVITLLYPSHTPQMLTIPVDDLLAFSKLCNQHFLLLEALFRAHTRSLLHLPTPQFIQILHTLEKGLMAKEAARLSKEVWLRSACCVSELCTFYYNELNKVCSQSPPQQPTTPRARIHTGVVVVGERAEAAGRNAGRHAAQAAPGR